MLARLRHRAFRSTELDVVIILVVKYGHARNANKLTFAYAVSVCTHTLREHSATRDGKKKTRKRERKGAEEKTRGEGLVYVTKYDNLFVLL